MSDHQTHFDVLGLPRAMRIDLGLLEKAYREASQKTHPDRFGQAGAPERRWALEQMTRVNDAYRTLKDPQKRAEYLLELEGVKVGKEESRTLDVDFLTEMLELQEKVDAERSTAGLEAMRKSAESRKSAIMDALAGYFDEHQGSKEAIAEKLAELRYIRRLVENIDLKLEELS